MTHSGLATDRESRDPRVDLFRGIALIVIAVDHILANPVARLTPVSWGYSDMAEVFLFLSGYVAGLSALKRRTLRQGLFSRFLIRSLQIYLAYVITTCLLLLLVRRSGSGSVVGRFGENLLSGSWTLVLRDILLLQGIASHLAILILYMFLLSTFPVIIKLCRWRPRLILLLSIGLYVWAQTKGFSLVQSFRQTAYYDPFAWQFIFYLGTVVALSDGRMKRLLEHRATLLAACLVVGTLHVLHGLGIVPIEWRMKPSLGPLRVVHFVGLAIVAQGIVPRTLPKSSCSRFGPARPWPIWSCIACGRHSLLIYCTGAIASGVASIWVEKSGRDSLSLVGANVFVIACLITIAVLAERFLPQQRQTHLR